LYLQDLLATKRTEIEDITYSQSKPLIKRNNNRNVVQVMSPYGQLFVPYDIIMLIIPVIISGITGLYLTKLLDSENKNLTRSIKDQLNWLTELTKAYVNDLAKNREISEEERALKLANYYELCRYQKYLIYESSLEKMSVRDLRTLKKELQLITSKESIDTTFQSIERNLQKAKEDIVKIESDKQTDRDRARTSDRDMARTRSFSLHTC
jgi:hypothetical protein